MAGGNNRRAGPPAARKPKTGRALWIGIMVLVSGWTFFLGVLVGRGTAPLHYDIDNLKEQLARAKAALLESEIKRFRIPSKSTETPVDLSFYEDLKKPEKGSAAKWKAVNRRKRQASERPAGPKGKRGPFSKRAPGLKPGKRKAQGPEGSLQSNAHGTKKTLTLQVAAFPRVSDARKLAEKLKKRGYPAYVKRVEIPRQGVWYRVRIGTFDSKKSASVMLEQLKKERFHPIVVNGNPK